MNETTKLFIEKYIQDINSNNWDNVLYHIQNSFFHEDWDGISDLFKTFKKCNILIPNDEIKDTFELMGYTNYIPFYNDEDNSTFKMIKETNSFLDSHYSKTFKINTNSPITFNDIIYIIKDTFKCNPNHIETHLKDNFDSIRWNFTNKINLNITLNLPPYNYLFPTFTVDINDGLIIIEEDLNSEIGLLIPGFGLAINETVVKDHFDNIINSINNI